MRLISVNAVFKNYDREGVQIWFNEPDSVMLQGKLF